jgi:hypothetical protein
MQVMPEILYEEFIHDYGYLAYGGGRRGAGGREI